MRQSACWSMNQLNISLWNPLAQDIMSSFEVGGKTCSTPEEKAACSFWQLCWFWWFGTPSSIVAAGFSCQHNTLEPSWMRLIPVSVGLRWWLRSQREKDTLLSDVFIISQGKLTPQKFSSEFIFPIVKQRDFEPTSNYMQRISWLFYLEDCGWFHWNRSPQRRWLHSW